MSVSPHSPRIIATDSVSDITFEDAESGAHPSPHHHHHPLDLDMPTHSTYKTVPIQILVDNTDRASVHLDDTPCKLGSVAVGGGGGVDGDEDGIWEDEEEDVNERHVHASVNEFDDDSDLTDDDSVDEGAERGHLSYRQAVQQYKQSRRALLRSSSQSYPSVGRSSGSKRSSHELAESNDFFSSSAHPHHHHHHHRDVYLAADATEPGDKVAPPQGRIHQAVFTENGLEEDEDKSPTGSLSKIQSQSSSHRFTHHPSNQPIGANLEQQLNSQTLSPYRSSPPHASKMHRQSSSKSLSPRMNQPCAPFTTHNLETLVKHETTVPSSIPKTTVKLEPTSAQEGEEPEFASGSSTPTQEKDQSVKLASTEKAVRNNGTDDSSTNAAPEPKKEADLATKPVSPQTSDRAPFSLWDYLQEEVLAADFDSTQEIKWERVTNFIAIPFWMEKIILFGFVVCLDSFLYTFTILPLRLGVAIYKWTSNTIHWLLLGGEQRFLHSSHKCDMLKALLIILSCFILSKITDASKMYHSVRGQDVVKLSVIFNVLEIADRLCCSFGQDLLDSLFSKSTLARRKSGGQPYLRILGFFVLSLAYVLAHTLVLFYQLVTLNVAINSYDNALLTLLLSNQFVEIKGSVFKKFEKENVFQLTCADIVERFQLTLMLSAIGLRNLIELSGGATEGGASPLPASFTMFPSISLLETVFTPVCIVLASECFVDWLKHAFITKFNHIRPAVYGRFMDVLCRDLVVGGPSYKDRARKHTFVDQSPIVSRRLGFAALPLACLLIRLTSQIVGMIGDTSHIDECSMPAVHNQAGLVGIAAQKLGAVDINSPMIRGLDIFVRGSAWVLTCIIAWAFLVALKLLLGTNLVSFASHRYATMHQREAEENLNSRNRPPIGVDKEEQSYDKKLVQLIDRKEDDAVQILLDGSHVAPQGKVKDQQQQVGAADGGNEKKATSLMDVSRYTMVRSRIW